MNLKKIVVLTDYSLLVQGIASRLRQSFHSLDVEEVDFNQPDLLQVLVQQNPQVIICGSYGQGQPLSCDLSSLFNLLPNLVVIEVNLENSNVQMIRSGQYNAADISGLVTMLESSGGSVQEIPSPL